MEAAAVSAVVSMTLKVVGNKLAPLLNKEYTSIVGVKRDLKDLRDQVEAINGWLETRYVVVWNDPSLNWLKRLKDVTYAVDDVVDEFQRKAEKHATDGGIISKYVSRKPKSFILKCKAARKIKKIKGTFAEIVKQREDYNTITNNISEDPPVRQTNMRAGGLPSWPHVDVSSVVGRNEDKKNIISKLQETDHQLKIKIISVIGLGGSGKTTLAKLVFNDGNIKKHFDFTLWVHVSQEFDVDNLVKKMFEDFADNNPGQHGMPYMRKTILEKLDGQRFLLVLDDVWTESEFQWKEFWEFLINTGAPGSRILLTTRSREVAETVGSTDQFLLPLLSKDSSWQLFIESCGMATNDLDSEFHDVGKEIVDKCSGLPLAIKVLAGVLRYKKQIDQWKATRDSNLLFVESKEHRVASCLMLSYFHLPSDLKQCFTICSVFPKGHNINKEQLIDLWIAHDMITVKDPFDYLSLENVGHEHFNSLLDVSFLQNFKEKDGRVTYGMHDLVHDLALSIMGDEISPDRPNEATSSTTKSYRYFSLIKQTEHMAPKNFFRKARAVYIPEYQDYIYAMALKHAKHLCSVTVGNLNAEGANTISQVKYLKYLAMSLRGCETLPKGVSDVWSLQALHVTRSYSLIKIPESIGKLKMLRTLNLSGCIKLESLPDSIGDCHMISTIDLCGCSNLTVLPDSIGKLQKLRTLNLSSCNKLKCLPNSIGDCHMISSIDLCICSKITMLPDSIGRNEKLRVLRLRFTKIKRLPSIITMLRNLECLDLQNCHELVELPEGIGNLVKLQVLNLKYCTKLIGMPIGIRQLSRLQKLGLFSIGKGEMFAGMSELANVSRFVEELTIIGIQHVMDTNDAHVACLKQKTNLQRLGLDWMSNKMEEVNTELQQDVLDGLEPPPGIKELKIIRYSGSQYARWMQSQVCGGVQGPSPFPFLREIVLCDFPNLKHLDGLVKLPCLQELMLLRMPSLESISGGPFPSLVKLYMSKLPYLGEVWLVPERTMPDVEDEGGCYSYNLTPHLGQVRVGSCLTELYIRGCPKLEVMSHFPLSLQRLILQKSEQVLQSLGQCQGCSWSPNFNKLKKLQLWKVTGLKSGHGWELLQHMTALESLHIHHFSGVQTELPESLWSLTSLQSLEVRSWSNIHALPELLGELRSLQELTIELCDSLTNLPQTMGQLTSLQELVIQSCKELHQLPDCLGELCSLRKLEIYALPELTCLPQSICRLSNSLQKLIIFHCPGITSLPQGMEGLASLEMLSIRYCPRLTSLPQRIEGLTSLKVLSIRYCPRLTSLPQSIEGLTSLKELSIRYCPRLTSLPQRIEGLTSLKELEIVYCPRLTSLPQGIKGLVSLEELWVSWCPQIKSLPEGIKDLTALKKLRISYCPDLERHCKRGKGEDWHLISHIPDVSFVLDG